MTFRFEDTKYVPEDHELLADLRAAAAGLGHQRLTQNDYRQVGRYSSTVIKKRFGSWNQAVHASGLTPIDRGSVDDNELFANLLSVWTTLGRQPRRNEMRPPLSKYTHHPYIRTYGGWLSAMKAFVARANATETELSTAEYPPTDPGGPRFPSMGLRFRVLYRDLFRCRSCGRSPAIEPGVQLHVDHIIPWASGGATTESNLQTLCDRCNLGKADGAFPAGAA